MSTPPATTAPDRTRVLLTLMLVLTFGTGVIDAVGYLGLDRVFAGNMTGNVVILGMALTGADDLPVAGPALALGGYLAGAALGGRILKRTPKGAWTSATTAVLAGGGVLLGAAAVVLFVVGRHAAPEVLLPVTTALAVAMGSQAAAARKIGVADVTTVVVTSTLTGLAADSRLGGGDGKHWARRAGAVVIIAAGAGAGALLLVVHVGWGVVLAAVLTLAVAGWGHWRGR